jgi:hypothetical protein
VRVGRSALDEDAIRLIERHNPDLTFDWTRILKGGADPEPVPADRRYRPRRPDERPAAGSSSRFEPPSRDTPPPATSNASAPGELPEEAPPDVLAAPLPQDEGVMTPALARFGPEGLLRLRARHAEVLARISEQPESPEREELKARADRLNPDTWVTAEEVTLGVEQYEAVFESLRGVIGRRRQRRRRPRDGDGPAPEGEANPVPDEPSAAADDPDEGA